MKGFKKCCISNGMDRSDSDMLWSGSEEGGNVRSVCARNMKALTVKTMMTVTPNGKGR